MLYKNANAANFVYYKKIHLSTPLLSVHFCKCNFLSCPKIDYANLK